MTFEITSNKDLVVNEVIDIITKRILSGELKSGDKLPSEVELMESMGVGRNTIREAIKMLTAQGVLVIKRGNGTFVADRVSTSIIDPLIFSLIIEPKNTQELYELRVLFESGALRFAAQNGQPDDYIKIRENLEKQKRLVQEGDGRLEGFLELDLEFHDLMFQATHNELIIKMGKTILRLYPEYMKKSLSQRNSFDRAFRRHQMILQAVVSKNYDFMPEIVEMSIDEWKSNWSDS